MTNRLFAETSPYLLQHRDNPVDWWSWGPEALAQARVLDRPILLSVGYAACHWCHVMAHESFENPQIAALMNDFFINIKVDREERPDLDAVYQGALALLGQQGGWPLTMFLTPAGETFWGGTYFPLAGMEGRPAFATVLQAVHDSWTKAREIIAENARILKAGLERQHRVMEAFPQAEEQRRNISRLFLEAMDWDKGGLGGAPKFPQPAVFDFLWRTEEAEAQRAVGLTLDHLCRGGIYDHLGGGFMRYATDTNWQVPHFEKMLYDNAQLIDLLTLVYQKTRSERYRSCVDQTVAWALREMRQGEAFAGALDADSEGHEGRFYTWTEAEIDQHLDAKAARDFKHAYDVRPEGNWEGLSILHQNHPGWGEVLESASLAEAREILWRVREKRPHPGRDDKILADWNGMMIGALARAGATFQQSSWITAATEAFDFVVLAMALPDERVAHTSCQGKTGKVGLLDDLAHMVRAGVVLFHATHERRFLDQARRWGEAAQRHHWDRADGGYFQTAHQASDVLVRLKLDGVMEEAKRLLDEAE